MNISMSTRRIRARYKCFYVKIHYKPVGMWGSGGLCVLGSHCPHLRPAALSCAPPSSVLLFVVWGGGGPVRIYEEHLVRGHPPRWDVDPWPGVLGGGCWIPQRGPGSLECPPPTAAPSGCLAPGGPARPCHSGSRFPTLPCVNPGAALAAGLRAQTAGQGHLSTKQGGAYGDPSRDTCCVPQRTPNRHGSR